jgi:hypothetical protein
LTYDFAPSGWISVNDAARRIADVPHYTAEDDEWRDGSDRLADAEAIHGATQKLRRWLCDAKLTASVLGVNGRIVDVAAWVWADNEVCMDNAKYLEPSDRGQFFSRKGLLVNETWKPVFVKDQELEALLRGEVVNGPSPSPKGKLSLGRPKESGAFTDMLWLDEMEKHVKDGATPWIAAGAVVADNRDSILRKPGARDENVAHRLYRKYSMSGRPRERSSA